MCVGCCADVDCAAVTHADFVSALSKLEIAARALRLRKKGLIVKVVGAQVKKKNGKDPEESEKGDDDEDDVEKLVAEEARQRKRKVPAPKPVAKAAARKEPLESEDDEEDAEAGARGAKRKVPAPKPAAKPAVKKVAKVAEKKKDSDADDSDGDGADEAKAVDPKEKVAAAAAYRERMARLAKNLEAAAAGGKFHDLTTGDDAAAGKPAEKEAAFSVADACAAEVAQMYSRWFPWVMQGDSEEAALMRVDLLVGEIRTAFGIDKMEKGTLAEGVAQEALLGAGNLLRAVVKGEAAHDAVAVMKACAAYGKQLVALDRATTHGHASGGAVAAALHDQARVEPVVRRAVAALPARLKVSHDQRRRENWAARKGGGQWQSRGGQRDRGGFQGRNQGGGNRGGGNRGGGSGGNWGGGAGGSRGYGGGGGGGGYRGGYDRDGRGDRDGGGKRDGGGRDGDRGRKDH